MPPIVQAIVVIILFIVAIIGAKVMTLIATFLLAIIGFQKSNMLIERIILNVRVKRSRKARNKRKYLGHYTSYKKGVNL